MRFTSIVSLVLFAATALAAPSATTVRVSYDQTYDVKSNSLDIVACSNGPNGLETKGYTTFGSLKNFPNIGGAQYIAGWNSASCGTCWQLKYNGKTINVVAIDHADSGFNLSLEAMNKLTNNQAEQLGVVQATVTSLPAASCSL